MIAKTNTVMATIFMTRITFLLNCEDLESAGFVSFSFMVLMYNGKSKKSKARDQSL